MEHAELPLKNLIVLLVAAGIVVPLLHRARIGAVLAFLLIGVLVGPHGYAQFASTYPWLQWMTISEGPLVKLLAELGVIFLLFLIGLELSMQRLWSLRRYVLGVGGLQFAISGAAIGFVVASVGVPPAGAIVLGLCLAMSSTAIVMQLLEQQGRTTSRVGRVALSVLLFQDLMVAPVLFGTEALGRGGDIAAGLASALFWAVVVIAGIVTAGYYLMRPLLRLAAQTGSREILVAITLLIVIGSSWLTGHFGLSTAVGAFLAGLLISESAYRHQVEIDIAPLKGLLLGVFFISVGMSIDAAVVWQHIHLVIAAVVGLLAIKATALYAAARIMQVPRPVAGEVAVLLPESGEFAFVAIGLAAASKLLDPQTAQLATVVAGLSMMTTPLCTRLGTRLGRWLDERDRAEHMPDEEGADLRDHVVVAGFGRVGEAVTRLLKAEEVSYIALDTSGDVVANARKAGANIYLGDATRRELIERVGYRYARAFVITVDEPESAERMVVVARGIRPDVPIFARGADPAHAVRLLQIGAVHVIPEAVEASLQLGARVLEGLGFPEEVVERRVDDARSYELRRLTAELDKK